MGLRKSRRVKVRKQSLEARLEQGERALKAKLRGVRPVSEDDRRIIRNAASKHPDGVPDWVLTELAVGEHY